MDIAQRASRCSTVRRRPLPALLLLAALGPVAFGGVGCGLLGSPPRPAVVSEAPPPPVDRPEPYVLLRLGERRVYVVDEASGGAPDAFPVAIGRPQYPTPTGRFQINEMIVDPDFVRFDWNDPSRVLGRIPPGPNNPLGVRWIGFAQAYGWTIGFHGTQKTDVLGRAVSHGCVRMRNSDVVELYDRVKIGTTVIVQP